MKIMRYSYCCGKPVTSNASTLTNKTGHICSRCKKPLTVYGNPILEDDKLELARKNKVAGRGHAVLKNGDLQLIDLLYKHTTREEKLGSYSDKYVIMTNKGEYLTMVKLEHTTGAFYEVLEPFESRLIKEKLCAHALCSFRDSDLVSQDAFITALKNLGYKFNKNGFMI